MDELLLRDLIGASKDTYGADYTNHVLEQYKLYVTMADQISQRRQSANSFFLAVNTGLVAMLGIGWPGSGKPASVAWYVIVGLAGTVLCYSWFRLAKSYQQLNAGKFRVVHAIESLLPLRLYDAEWRAIGRGEDPSFYLPFTNVELWIPAVYFVLYLALVVTAVISRLYA